MIKAAIDIGTNSTRLLVADAGKEIRRIEKTTVITRLGKNVDRDKKLGTEGMEKNIEVLRDFKRTAMSFGCQSITAIATSAVRDASNREEFVKAVRDRVGIDIMVIAGSEEAELGFLGASSVLDDNTGIVCDIGGGSTELIWGAGGRVSMKDSIDIGAVRITERFLNPGRVSGREIEAAALYIREMVLNTKAKIGDGNSNSMAGIGGTATTLAAIDQGLKVYDIDKVHGYKLQKERVDLIFNSLKNMSLEERQNVPGLQRERADIITGGALILKMVMEELSARFITVSECDNLDGAIMKYSMQ
jgi:Exopolyphosphatase